MNNQLILSCFAAESSVKSNIITYIDEGLLRVGAKTMGAVGYDKGRNPIDEDDLVEILVGRYEGQYGQAKPAGPEGHIEVELGVSVRKLMESKDVRVVKKSAQYMTQHES